MKGFSFLFFLLLPLFASSQAMACRCANPEPKSAYARADAVVLVKVKTVVQVQEGVEHVETEVFQSWKTKVTGDENILAVFLNTNVCPYPHAVQEGGVHLLYLKKLSASSEGFPEGFWTGNCVGSWPESHPQAAKHIQWLNRHGKKI